jgi:hypothetical protein
VRIALDDPPEAFDDPEAWTPIVETLECTMIPKELEPVLKEAIEKARATDPSVNIRAWQALEMMAADYVAGP